MPVNKTEKQGGFTFIEVVISCLIMILLVTAVIHYHTTAGVSKDQTYYLKAVQTARAELEKLRALFELDRARSFTEFVPNGPPPRDIFLFKFTSSTGIELPNPIFRVYYKDHHSSYDGIPFLRPLGSGPPYGVNVKNSVLEYPLYYQDSYNGQSDDDQTDRKSFTYFSWDSNPIDQTDSAPDNGKVDASLVVLDDMGSPYDPQDDLIGNIGWWVEDASSEGPGLEVKKITFVLQFWYPGQEKSADPEVIILKSTFVRPDLTG
jgi:hypothetical protein